MTVEAIAFLAGACLLAVGILGGGVEIKEIRIPKLGIFARYTALALGAIFVAISLWLRIEAEPPIQQNPASVETSTHSPSGAEAVGAANTHQGYYFGTFNGNNYRGEAKVFSCPNGENLNTGNKTGISAFCISGNGASVYEGQYTGGNFQGKHKVFSCPEGTRNAESGDSYGIFAWCYANGVFVRARHTGGTYEGKYKVFRCKKGSVNLESGSRIGIASLCKN